MKRKNQSSSTNKFLKKKQFGGSTYVEKPIRNPEGQFVDDYDIIESDKGSPILQRTFAKERYPEVDIRYLNDNDSNIPRREDGSIRPYFIPETNTAYVGKGSYTSVPEELAHAEQARRYTFVPSLMTSRAKREIDRYTDEGRYEAPGTLEYEAHKIIEPKLQKDYDKHVKNTRRGAQYRMIGGLEDFLGRKNPAPIVREEITRGYNKQQYGGTSQNILAEDGEVYLDENGELQEVRGFSHDDSFVELPNGQKIVSSKGNGGQILDDVTSVLSDSYTQVKEGERKNTEKEQQIAIKSKDAKKLFDYKWFNTGKNKKYSPSELVKEVLKQRDKKLSQYSDVQKDDALTLSTNQLNASLLPSDEDIYITVLGEQENSKGSEFNENMAQYGKVIPVNSKGLYEEEGPVIVPTNGTGNITMSGVDQNVAAYDADTGEYLDTMHPNQQYKFEADNILEIPMKKFGVKKAQFGEDGTYFPPKYKVKSGDSLSKIASDYGLDLETLLQANPNIANSNRINIGDEINIPDVTIKGKGNTPIDRMSEIEGMEELPEELNIQAEEVIPTLDVKATTVASVNSSNVLQEAKKAVDKIKLGRIDRTQGTNALREMMRANRSINLPYRAETPRRLYEYLEEDVTPYLDELDSQSTQALQNVNQNTAQGQAIAANILNRVGMNKRQTINRANSMNLQRRQQTDNANVQLQNQFDLMQEQNNKNYVDETYQTLANYDRNRVQQAEYLDEMINQNTRTKNFFTMENMRNSNYQIDPVTGEVFRIGTPLKQSQEKKAQFGIKRKKNKMC